MMIDSWRPVAERTGALVRIIEISVPLAVALARNAARARQVPEGVIRRQYEQMAVPLPATTWYIVLVVPDLPDAAPPDQERPQAQAGTGAARPAALGVEVAPAGYVTQVQAVAATGILPSTLRTWVNRGQIPTWSDPTARNSRQGGRLVLLTAVQTRVQKKAK